MTDIADLLRFALAKRASSVRIADLRTLVVNSRRGSGDSGGSVEIAAPDSMLKSIRGEPAKATHRWLVVAIPAEVEKRSKSRIVLPGE